ncbi:hypothetical protein [Streptomyces marianii]|uniref:hypothetical protein n=1 Tax=Streptomyces marianii TaxID=1817406 RepID=UPI001F1BCDB0|nr:hypothetical protein [Streptomyces marianii]
MCPLGVLTEMYERSDAAGKEVVGASVPDPQDVADEVMKGLADGRFLILPHAEVRDHYAHRVADTDRWLRGMRRLRHRIDDAAAGRHRSGAPGEISATLPTRAG